MSDIAIKVRGRGKKYYIGEKLPQRSLAGSIKNAAGFPWKVAKSLIAGKALDQREEFWALKDVAFDVKQGEVLGIIGRNGAGKSTLLKILSRITTPTEGEVELFGRVGCLLEVGTGFHPELTGRENVFLNGSLLGMSNVEIKQRFDEIVDFSGVERFLDTPVKFYSSGMYTRLAFSVAAHLNPEILIVDEVLAVGDAEFQKKCLGKMDSIAKSGRTIIFVSHNMMAVKQLCSKGIYLNEGKMQYAGSVNAAIDTYLNLESFEQCGEISWETKSAPGNDEIKIKAIRIRSENEITGKPPVDKDISIEIEYFNYIPEARRLVSIWVVNIQGIPVFTSCNLKSASKDIDEWCYKPYKKGLYKTVCKIPGDFFNPGIFYVNLYINSKGALDNIFKKDSIISFKVEEVDRYREEYHGEWIGAVRPLLEWKTTLLES